MSYPAPGSFPLTVPPTYPQGAAYTSTQVAGQFQSFSVSASYYGTIPVAQPKNEVSELPLKKRKLELSPYHLASFSPAYSLTTSEYRNIHSTPSLSYTAAKPDSSHLLKPVKENEETKKKNKFLGRGFSGYADELNSFGLDVDKEKLWNFIYLGPKSFLEHQQIFDAYSLKPDATRENIHRILVKAGERYRTAVKKG